MEPECGLQFSQTSVTRSYPEPLHFTPVHTLTFYVVKIHFNIILPSMPGCPKWGRPFSLRKNACYSRRVQPISDAGFEAITALIMKSSIYCDIISCNPLKVNRSFWGTCRFHLQGLRICHAKNQQQTSKKLATGKQETSRTCYLLKKNLVCDAIGTAATPGLLFQPRVIVKMIVEKQMECRLAGEIEVLGENLTQPHFCPSQNPTWTRPGFEAGPPRWEAGD
jgi:hypothetical protein